MPNSFAGRFFRCRASGCGNLLRGLSAHCPTNFLCGFFAFCGRMLVRWPGSGLICRVSGIIRRAVLRLLRADACPLVGQRFDLPRCRGCIRRAVLRLLRASTCPLAGRQFGLPGGGMCSADDCSCRRKGIVQDAGRAGEWARKKVRERGRGREEERKRGREEERKRGREEERRAVEYGRAVLLALQNTTRSRPGWRRGRLFQAGYFRPVISNRHFKPFDLLPDGG